MAKLKPSFPEMRAPWTATVPLPGGDIPVPFDQWAGEAAKRYSFLDPVLVNRLCRAYGTRIDALLEGVAIETDLGRDFGAGLSEREVDYLVANEWAVTADDVLWRRTKLGLRFAPSAVADLTAYLEKRRHDAAHPRHRSGHDLVPRHRLRPWTEGARGGAEGVRPAFPEARLGRARSGGNLALGAFPCRAAIRKAGIAPAAIAAIGITNQRETVVVWDRKTGKPIHPAIVWQDRRTATACAALRDAGHEAAITAKTGLLLDPYFSATKINWLLNHVKGARRRAERGELCFGTIDTFLIWRLTGGRVHATDATNASRTLLFDIHKGAWDDDLLALFNVPRAMLPEVKDCAADYGVTDKASSARRSRSSASPATSRRRPSARPASRRAC